ncbi:hypothetical protein ACO0M4_29110 [Streptomyces sp. RGM 3693]|uniref:hypothetical protein n=1 Tax=Streptomyces sp. RGM 3693 TaxID=3413284 RepID=UPI003D2BC389
MTEPAEVTAPTKAPLRRDRRTWIAIATGVAVIAAGAVLVWPKGHRPEVPDDLCAVIGAKTLTDYAPNNKFESDKIAPDIANCDGHSSPGGYRLTIELDRDGGHNGMYANLCQKMKSHEERPENLIKPSETAEFGDKLCGWIATEPSKSSIIPLTNDSDLYVVHGDAMVTIRYSGGTGSRDYQLQRTLNLTRSVLTALK